MLLTTNRHNSSVYQKIQRGWCNRYRPLSVYRKSPAIAGLLHLDNVNRGGGEQDAGTRENGL